jgi:hypothetical protein
MILQKTFTNYPEASGLMQELFELSRFLSGSEFLQQEHGKQKGASDSLLNYKITFLKYNTKKQEK